MGTKHKQLMEAGGVSKLHLAVFQGKQEKVGTVIRPGSPYSNRQRTTVSLTTQPISPPH